MKTRPKSVVDIAKLWLGVGAAVVGFALLLAILDLTLAKDSSNLEQLGCFFVIGCVALLLAFGVYHLEEWAYDFSDFLFTFRPKLQGKLHEPEVRAAFGKLPEDYQ